jgi:hypothetical protein
MNKILRILSAATLLTYLGLFPSYAAGIPSGAVTVSPNTPTPTVVIVDTGYDPSITQFTNKIIYEQCFTSFYASCPNGKNTMSGPGAAALSPAQLAVNQTGHGSEMLSGEILTNPNIKFIYIRAFSIETKPAVMLSPYDSDLSIILDWVAANAATYNIQAVSMSFARPMPNGCQINPQLALATTKLISLNIPVFAGAGNAGNENSIDFPACNTGIIAVGGEINNLPAYWSNHGPNLSWDALGTLTVTSVGNKSVTSIGTSIATTISAASWVAIRQSKPNLNYQQIYSLIRNTATISSSTYVENVPIMNLVGALK